MKRKLIKILVIILVFCSCKYVKKKDVEIDSPKDSSTKAIFSFEDTCISESDTICLSDTQEFVAENENNCYIPIPEFPGGNDSLNSFFRKNLEYPDSAQENGIQGKVYVGFTVEKDGCLSDIKIVGKNTFGYGLEEEALRIVKMMPRWNFRNSTSKPKKVKFVLPISFKLEK